MKNKINSRLIGLSVFSIIITALLLTIVYYTNFRQQVEKDLSLTAHVLASNDFVNDEIDLSFVKNEIRVTWIDTDGSVIYDKNKQIKTNHNKNGIFKPILIDLKMP